MLFFGRFIEGVGMGLIMVAAPFAISVWFPAQKRALATGIWASSVGVRKRRDPPSRSLHGRILWLAFSTGGQAPVFRHFAFVLFAVLFRMPRREEMYEAPAPAAAATRGSRPVC